MVIQDGHEMFNISARCVSRKGDLVTGIRVGSEGGGILQAGLPSTKHPVWGTLQSGPVAGDHPAEHLTAWLACSL